MLMVSSAGYTLYLLRIDNSKAKVLRQLLALVTVLLVTITTVVLVNKPLQSRLQLSINALGGDREVIDVATGRRSQMWETSVQVFKDHWFNGVGPRGFRSVYQDYSNEENYFYETGQTHPHQLLLEIMAEAGVLGIAGFLFFLACFYRFASPKAWTPEVFPPLLACTIALFPLNT